MSELEPSNPAGTGHHATNAVDTAAVAPTAGTDAGVEVGQTVAAAAVNLHKDVAAPADAPKQQAEHAAAGQAQVSQPAAMAATTPAATPAPVPPNDGGNSGQTAQSAASHNSGQAAPQAAAPAATHVNPANFSQNMAQTDSLQKPLTLAVAVLAVLLAAQWWSSNNEMRALREEMAKRLQSNDVVGAEARMMAKSAQDGSKELHARYSILENKQAEAQSQQLALEQLYQELSRNRDDWALAEIEQVLSTASQQLQLAGNVQGALIALQNADRTLSRSDKPQFILIRRAIAKDTEKLKALPNLDLPGIALRLDSAIGQIDNLPLLSDEKTAAPSLPPKKVAAVRIVKTEKADKTADKPEPEPGLLAQWGNSISNTWHSLSSEMWLEVQQLIRVRSVDTPSALMMSPGQAYFAKENLKLRLLNARLALLSRNEGAFRNDLESAQGTISKYFDTRAKPTQTVQTLLKQVQASNLSIEMPTLAESLTAVSKYKAKP